MSNLDETFDRMAAFARQLEAFRDALEASVADLDRCHSAVDPLWRDERRRLYDAIYQPLHDDLMYFVRTQGSGYADFLAQKLRVLEEYLHG